MLNCISILLLTPVLLFSQSPAAGDLIWHTFQGEDRADEAYAIDSDAAGNVYIVGKGWTDWDMTGQPYVAPVNDHNPHNIHFRDFDVFV